MKKFSEELKKMIAERIDSDIEIKEVEIVKMNDEELHGLVFTRSDTEASPTLYIEDAYSEYCDGTPIEDIADMFVEALNIMIKEYDNAPNEHMGVLDDYKSKLRLRLVEADRNEKWLKDVIHKPVEAGLEVVLDVVDNDYHAVVTNGMVEHLEADVEEMFVYANCNVMEDVKFGNMVTRLFGIEADDLFDLHEAPAGEKMYVLTNRNNLFGAAAFAFAVVREKIASLIGEYYALPSSINEIICVPASEGISSDEFSAMVKGANEFVVPKKEILSDHVYYVDMKGKVTVVA